MFAKILCIAFVGFFLVQAEPLWRREKRSPVGEPSGVADSGRTEAQEFLTEIQKLVSCVAGAIERVGDNIAQNAKNASRKLVEDIKREESRLQQLVPDIIYCIESVKKLSREVTTKVKHIERALPEIMACAQETLDKNPEHCSNEDDNLLRTAEIILSCTAETPVEVPEEDSNTTEGVETMEKSFSEIFDGITNAKDYQRSNDEEAKAPMFTESDYDSMEKIITDIIQDADDTEEEIAGASEVLICVADTVSESMEHYTNYGDLVIKMAASIVACSINDCTKIKVEIGNNPEGVGPLVKVKLTDEGSRRLQKVEGATSRAAHTDNQAGHHGSDSAEHEKTSV